jgi:hypothetical protein
LILDRGTRDCPLPEGTHLAFFDSPKSFEAARKRLRDAGAPVWQDSPTEGRSIYFVGSDGHTLEIYTSSLAGGLEADRRNFPTGTRFYSCALPGVGGCARLVLNRGCEVEPHAPDGSLHGPIRGGEDAVAAALEVVE